MEKGEIRLGAEIWLRCDVSSGPLSEHLVRLRLGDAIWFGFVKSSELSSDQKKVRATVLDLKNQTVTIGIRGHSPTSNNAIQTSREQIASGVGAVA
jgi:hypothetical protein